MTKVRDFIIDNYRVYEGDSSFLVGASVKTKKLYEKVRTILTENKLNVDLENISGIDNFKPGYIDKENEIIYGLQSDEPLKRIINPYGGIRMAETALEEGGMSLNPKIKEIFTKYRKTHNQGVFDAYTKDVRKMRKSGVITGLPDAYGRGRIIGDYRRVALFGIDALIEDKQKDLNTITTINEDTIRLREEVTEQIRALEELKSMALKYGDDISKPAENAREAIQYTYYAYLAAIKENNGAAMSLGRCSTFFDIYIEKDLENKLLTEEEAQELIDQFVIKLRLVRHLRTKDYDDLFAGDPTWVTESIGGMTIEGKPLVTKTSFRMLQTLINLGPSPEPNLTILWSKDLPEGFKKFVSKISIETSSIQYENDDIMRPIFGDDYGIACCVSAMKLGEQMQYFGARCNIAKALLYAINGGIDEKSFDKVIDGIKPITSEVLDYKEVYENYIKTLDVVAKNYVDAMNTIHYMHDKYAYERIQMALHDTEIERLMSFGIAGLSVVIDSLSAIKNAKVKPVRNENGIAIDFEIEGDYPKFGNDNDNVDTIGVDIVTKFKELLDKYPLIRNAKHTLSVLTITSNVVYGKKTGSTPDGRKVGRPFAPGANPMHGRDENGALASLNSVAKLPYCACLDGISNTFSMAPTTLGKTEEERIDNLVSVLNGYFENNAHHLNVNILQKEMLEDAMNHPENYPSLTIRVSGYAVNFVKLTKEEQLEVLERTFHDSI